MSQNPKRKKKTFSPVKRSRYLQGQVDIHTAMIDLRYFNIHKSNIFHAKATIDAKPPTLNPNCYLRASKLVADANRVIDIDRENKMLINKINTINRTTGFVDTYNPVAYMNRSKWKKHVCEMKFIEIDNQKLLKLITAAVSDYSRKYHAECWEKLTKEIRSKCKLKYTIADHDVDKMASLTDCRRKSWNPKCFMDFAVQDGCNLGRIIIELYIDYVPKTVQNFIALCNAYNKLTYKNCHVYKIAAGKCIELGDITRNCGKGGLSSFKTSFKEENYYLKHSRPGVVSMVRVGKQRNDSKFSISLATDESLNGKRVAFGKIVKGMDVIFAMEGMGRKFGKPMPPIYVKNCGECKHEVTKPANDKHVHLMEDVTQTTT